MTTISSSGLPHPSSGCAHILQHQQQQTTDRHKVLTIGHIADLCRFANGMVCSGGSCRIIWSVNYSDMFTSLTDRKAFGAAYESAVLSVLPMNTDKQRHGLRCTEVNQALGMPKEARTTLTLLLKRMAAQGIVTRYEYMISGRKFITYKRNAPLRKREMIARWIWRV